MEKCLGNDLLLFIISGYLPGEYVLRVFPLLCRGMKSRPLSLSLLGPSVTRTKTFFSLEGEIYRVYSIWRDLQRIIKHDYLITAFKLTENFIPRTHAIPSIEKLSFPRISQSFFSTPFSFDHFPKLNQIEIGVIHDFSAEEMLTALWKLPLVSLTTDEWRVTGKLCDAGPPAFAHTLRSLFLWSVDCCLLDLLSPYCRNLTEITCFNYHEIIGNNLSLTLLNLDRTIGESAIDLTQHTRLVELSVHGGRSFFSKGTHPQLEFVSLRWPDLDCATDFLLQCPTVKHVSLCCADWESLVKISAVLNPEKCKRLTLAPIYTHPPSLDDVEKLIIQRGFQIDEDFLIYASGNWGNIVPHIKHWQVLQDVAVDRFLTDSAAAFVFSTFHALSVIDLASRISWDQQMLSSVVASCSMLKELKILGAHFSGAIELHSQLLCKLHLSFSCGVSGFDLILPQLTHLSLQLPSGEGPFLQALLDGDQLLQLPRLRVLSIAPNSPFSDFSTNPEEFTVSCEIGHQSLTRLIIVGRRQIDISNLTLRHLPHLKEVTLIPLPPAIEITLDVPGSCDITLWSADSFSTYTRIGCSDPLNFTKEVYYEATQWIFKGEEKMEENEGEGKLKRGKEKGKRRGKREKQRKENNCGVRDAKGQ